MANELNINSPSGATVYAIIRRESDSYVWNGTTFVVWANGDIASYDVALTDRSGDYYSVDFPSGITTAGQYFIQYYVQAGGTPAITDFCLPASESMYWNGTAAVNTPSSGDLTTLTLVKYQANIPTATTTYDTILSSLITAASRWVEAYCDRLFISATRTEYHNGRGKQWLSLNAYPINSVTKCGLLTEALQVTNTTASNQIARAAISSTALTLTRIASGTTTTNSLTLASYATIDDLVTAIDAVGGGWDASTLNSYGGYPATDLHPYSGAVSASSVKGLATFGVYDDAEIWDFTFNPDTGSLIGWFPVGYRNIQVTYSGGWSTLPDDLQTAVAMLVADMYRATALDGNLSSEKIGDYAYTLADRPAGSTIETLSPRAAMMLAQFKRPRLCL